MEPQHWKYVVIGILILLALCLIYMCFFGTRKKRSGDTSRSGMDMDEEEVVGAEEIIPVKYDNYIKISLPRHPQFIGSQIIVKTPNNTYLQTHTNDQGTIMTFPLNTENIVEIVKVRTYYGDDIEYNYPQVNSTIIVDPNLEKLSKEINDIRNRIMDYDDLPDSTQGLNRRFDRLRY